VLNIFNLLPVEPLDGGVALRSVLNRLFGTYARYALMAIGVLFAVLGLYLSQLLLVVFGFIAIAMNFRKRPVDTSLASLTRWQVGASLAGYFGIIAGYFILLLSFRDLGSVFEAVKVLTPSV
jgi:Zn-dependent protease